ncbi:hypothetical protein PCLA_12f0313 [Pseudomonas citronellolis]|nr:hypothetical protein PCLA_12f0313 [Pseudomonas citronellolis]
MTVLARYPGTVDEHAIVVHMNLPFAHRRIAPPGGYWSFVVGDIDAGRA